MRHRRCWYVQFLVTIFYYKIGFKTVEICSLIDTRVRLRRNNSMTATGLIPFSCYVELCNLNSYCGLKRYSKYVLCLNNIVGIFHKYIMCIVFRNCIITVMKQDYYDYVVKKDEFENTYFIRMLMKFQLDVSHIIYSQKFSLVSLLPNKPRDNTNDLGFFQHSINEKCSGTPDLIVPFKYEKLHPRCSCFSNSNHNFLDGDVLNLRVLHNWE